MRETDRAGETLDATGHGGLPSITLEITCGRAKHRSRPIRSTAFLIGSAEDCDLVLGDPSFDPVHSYVFVRPGRVTIRQLGNGPSLYVGGRQVGWAVLQDFDRLQMGSYEFEVRIEWPRENGDVMGRDPAPREALPLELGAEPATERLLSDVEDYDEAPKLTLFVGDERDDVDDALPPLSAVDPRAWRQPPKKASY